MHSREEQSIETNFNRPSDDSSEDLRFTGDCPDLQDIRRKYFTASSLKDIFERVNNQKIVSFIKDAHFLPSTVVFVILGFIVAI